MEDLVKRMHGPSAHEEAYAMVYARCALRTRVRHKTSSNQYSPSKLRPHPLLPQHSLYRHQLQHLYRPGNLTTSSRNQPSFRLAVCSQPLLLPPLPSLVRGMYILPTARAPCPPKPDCSGVHALGTRNGLGKPALPPRKSTDSKRRHWTGVKSWH